MNDLKVWKAIFEVRFPATASLFDKRGAIATRWQWQEDFTEWQISNNQVTIHNKPNTKFLRVGLGNAVTICEEPEGLQAFKERAEDFTCGILDLMQPKQIERVGLRVIRLATRKHFKLLASNMRKRLFTLTDDDWAIVGGPPHDLAFPLILSFGEDKANFMIGPMLKEQLVSYFDSTEVKDKLPESVLFVDFDMYRENLSVAEAEQRAFLHQFIHAACDKAISTGDAFVDRYGGFQ